MEDAEVDGEPSEHTVCLKNALNSLLANRKKDSKSENVSNLPNHYLEFNYCLPTQEDSSQITIIENLNDISALDFQNRFLFANRPCLVRSVPEFDRVSALWTRQDPSSSTHTTTCINRTWFRTMLGSDHLVPLRIQPDEGVLDSEGRATECRTQDMTIDQWVRLLQDNHVQRTMYLKDWHLQGLLQQKGIPPLYKVPDHLEYDLLNGFLGPFGLGDYRFVYWGPAGSQTLPHSDVMNSFSWSYNVHGQKEWTFYPVDAEPIVLLQGKGELIVVPATWKHHVRNLQETLSINHNWVTTANLHLMIDCLFQEIVAIDEELQAWRIDANDWEARENMLRGCLGVDVTTTLLMILTRYTTIQKTRGEFLGDKQRDLYRLGAACRELVEHPAVCWEERLLAVVKCSSGDLEHVRSMVQEIDSFLE